MYDAVYARFAQPAVYTDGDGEVRSASVVVKHDLRQYGDIANVSSASAVLHVRASEVQARPRRDDMFTLTSGGTYYVDRVLLSDGYEHRCLAHER